MLSKREVLEQVKNSEELVDLAKALERFMCRVYGQEDTVETKELLNSRFSIAHTEMFEGSELNVYLNLKELCVEKCPSITDDGYMECVYFTDVDEMINYIDYATFESLTDLTRDFEEEYYAEQTN